MSPLPASSARRCRRRSWSPLCHKRLMLLARRLGSTPRAPSPPPIPSQGERRDGGGQRAVRIAGIVKGAGMIAPDMATMLAFVFTDAAITPAALQLSWSLCRPIFNCITVDSDTSTNDTVLAFRTGAADHAPITDAADSRADPVRTALDAVMLDLAQQVVKDGEGISKFVTINSPEPPTTAPRERSACGRQPRRW